MVRVEVGLNLQIMKLDFVYFNIFDIIVSKKTVNLNKNISNKANSDFVSIEIFNENVMTETPSDLKEYSRKAFYSTFFVF